MIDFLLHTLYVLTILGIIFVERKSPTEALMWVLVVVCLPYLGLLLYLVFGSTVPIKITAWSRERKLKKQFVLDPYQQEAPVSDEQISDEDREVIRFNSIYNNSRLTSYQDLELLTGGEAHYRRLFADLQAAQSCIYIEFYTIHHDVMGEALVKTLAEKAKQGVKVLVLCDFIANISTPRSMFKPLTEAGGRVIRVKPYLTHYRSHRKIVVIDHKIAYIGGMNIGKQYANLAPKKTPWRDTQVRLTGACTYILENYFFSDFLCAEHKRNWKNSIDYVKSLEAPQIHHSGHLCQFITGGVDNRKEGVKMCYLSMIRSAKRSIRIQSPYFVPDVSILEALKTAAAAGVKIEIMIPGIPSSFFLEPVTTYYAGQLLEYGAKVYRYNGYIHAKTMIIDDELCCIGSVNMDMRSFQVDDEVCGVFYPNLMVQQYSSIYDNDITNCREYTWEQFKSRSTFQRFKESIFLLFAPLM